MAKKRLGISSFDIDKKFESKEEAFKYGKRLREHIRYICKKNANKGWQCQAMICISNIRGNSAFTYYEHNGKVGRPKVAKDFSSFDIRYYGNALNVKWHIHVLIVSKPMYAFRDDIKNYIDKNWGELKDNKNKFDFGILNKDKKVYKKNTNINKAEYFIQQSVATLFCNYNYTNEIIIPDGYSLKDLYKAYMKSKTALKYCGKYIKSNNWGEKEMLDAKYEKIKKFYLDITKEEDEKASKEYMEMVKNNKIKDYYRIKYREIDDSIF